MAQHVGVVRWFVNADESGFETGPDVFVHFSTIPTAGSKLSTEAGAVGYGTTTGRDANPHTAELVRTKQASNT